LKKEHNLLPYLDDLEKRIQPDEEQRLEQKWLQFTDGKWTEPYFAPVRNASPAKIVWPSVSINDAIESTELMILHQLKSCSDLLAKGSGNLLNIRANYGTGIIPTMFGAEVFYLSRELETLPGTKPLPKGKKSFSDILSKASFDYDKGFAQKVFETADRYLEVTKGYPNISRFVNFYMPDLQGPLPLVEMMWGSDFYIDIYDEPELVEEALDFMTDVYIDFSKKWKKLCPDFDSEHAVEWGLLHRGGTMIRNDAAMNISGEMYDEYVRPRDQKIIDIFGGCIHFCGRADHYIEKLSKIKGLSGINMSQPDWNDMETIYRNTVDKGLMIIGMPEWEVARAMQAGRPLRGLVHCGTTLAALDRIELNS